MRRAGDEMIFEYYLKDHLGNTRVMFGDNDGDGIPETLQEDHYYPAVYPENREPQNG